MSLYDIWSWVCVWVKIERCYVNDVLFSLEEQKYQINTEKERESSLRSEVKAFGSRPLFPMKDTREGRTPSAADSGGGRGRRGGGRGWIGVWIGIGFGIGSRVRDDEAAAFVPLHVTYAPDGLQLRFCGAPVVPVFKFTVFEDELAPAITRVHVAHPSETQHSPRLEWNHESHTCFYIPCRTLMRQLFIMYK